MLTEKAIAQVTVSVIKEHTAPLLARIADLEKQFSNAPAPAPLNGIDGKDGADGADGRDGIDGKDGLNGKDGAAGRDGIDGIGVSDAMIDRDGNLVLTTSTGAIKTLGRVIGSDGRDGADGKDGLNGTKGADGKDGADGRDGLGFDDMSIEYDGERNFKMVFAKGETKRVFSFDMPVILDRGVFTDGKEYAPGDAVSFGGSMWIAKRATENKPGLSDDWRLSVKKGRNGKEA
jgi:hypothetical protein